MAKKRTAEIAGAGLGGLTAGIALAQRGWRVRVHESASELRDIGVGTSIWSNGQRVLQAVGALDEVVAAGNKVARIEVHDERGRILRAGDLVSNPNAQGLVILRVDLHRALVNAAQRAGVEILTSSWIVGADPGGALIGSKGERFHADLVIGADGYHSKVRDSLGLAEHVGYVTDAHIGRVTVPRDDVQKLGSIREYWAGTRCCGVLNCNSLNYLFLSAPEDCPDNREEVHTKSFAKSTWINAFPFLKDVFERVENQVIWGRYPIVRCRAWSSGRAAILGDAAHAMPSTLAQGAGCAMANALALAEAVTVDGELPSTLTEWERRERPITEITQRWAILYLTLLKRWPLNLLDSRSEMALEAFSSNGILEHFSTAARHVVSVGRTPPLDHPTA